MALIAMLKRSFTPDPARRSTDGAGFRMKAAMHGAVPYRAVYAGNRCKRALNPDSTLKIAQFNN